MDTPVVRWRVSINGLDPEEFEAYTAAGAAAQAEVDFNNIANERRAVETLVVHRAERKPLPPVKAMVLDGKSGWANDPRNEPGPRY